MTKKYYRYKHWVMAEWKCCDKIWQLLLSKRYPERYKWNPICNCGNTIK